MDAKQNAKKDSLSNAISMAMSVVIIAVENTAALNARLSIGSVSELPIIAFIAFETYLGIEFNTDN